MMMTRAPRAARTMTSSIRRSATSFNVSAPAVARSMSTTLNTNVSGGAQSQTAGRVPGPVAHGGELKQMLAQPSDIPPHNRTMELNERQVCDLELIVNGGFSPLEGFMTESEYNSVVETHRLPTGTLFGMPTVLDTNDEAVQVGDYVELRSNQFGGRLAVMLVESKWSPNKANEGLKVYGTDSTAHPAVDNIVNERGRFYLGGRIFGVDLASRGWVDCKTPLQIREKLHGQGDKNVVAFQCRNPIHRVHAQMIMNVAREHSAEVLVHPVIGPTKSDDIPATVRVRTYEAIKGRLGEVGAHMEYLPYNMMVGGPREALQHMLVRKNYGCTHMIVGRDHAGCKVNGEDAYGPYDAQEFIAGIEEELGVTAVEFQELVYIAAQEQYVPAPLAKEQGLEVAKISGTEFRRRLRAGEPIPSWFAFDEVVDILRAETAVEN